MQADIKRNNRYLHMRTRIAILKYVNAYHLYIIYIFHSINSPKRHRFRFCIGLCLGLEENIKHMPKTLKTGTKYF
jgi:hypothetical protein